MECGVCCRLIAVCAERWRRLGPRIEGQREQWVRGWLGWAARQPEAGASGLASGWGLGRERDPPLRQGREAARQYRQAGQAGRRMAGLGFCMMHEHEI